jgi:hypothetical protein
LVSLVLQAAGGAITSIADSDQQDLAQAGINIMIAGLSCQVASLALFMALCLQYAWKVYKNPNALNKAAHVYELRNSIRWKAFLVGKSIRLFFYDQALITAPGLALATITIFVRSVFRVAELKGGFHSALANDQVLFMVLEGAMIVIAILCLTVLHPGVCFGGLWNQTTWTWTRSIGSELEFISISTDAQGKP